MQNVFYNPFNDYPYLAMFYALPEELVEKSGLSHFTRKPWDVIYNSRQQEIYHSDIFTLCLIDTWAWLVWPHFGIRGSLESYSGHDPFWQLAHSLPIWQKVLKELHIADSLAFVLEDRHGECPYLSYEQTDKIAQAIVYMFFTSSKYDIEGMKQAVLEHRAIEDFDYRASYVKDQFKQKYYHSRKSRSKAKPTLPPKLPPDYWEKNRDLRVSVQHFISTLGEKDQEICRLLGQNYTQQEIAEKLGFANHSAVSKRIKHIREAITEFDSELRPTPMKTD